VFLHHPPIAGHHTFLLMFQIGTDRFQLSNFLSLGFH
jgi:hypothetical protein